MSGSFGSTKEWILRKETELRCEISESMTLSVKLVAGSGTAEIFGVEMAPNKEYIYRDQNIAIFTWYGCVIETTGDQNTLYIADSPPMVAYVNTHIQLEARRDVAVFNKDQGPRVKYK
jgi:polyribonucleotide 5'-hydroxyl-kinase